MSSLLSNEALAEKYIECKERFKQLEKELKQLHEQVIQEIFQDRPGKFAVPSKGKTLVYEEVTASRFDSAKLKAAMPSLYATLSVEYTYKRLSINEGGSDDRQAE